MTAWHDGSGSTNNPFRIASTSLVQADSSAEVVVVRTINAFRSDSMGAAAVWSTAVASQDETAGSVPHLRGSSTSVGRANIRKEPARPVCGVVVRRTCNDRRGAPRDAARRRVRLSAGGGCPAGLATMSVKHRFSGMSPHGPSSNLL